MTPSDCRLRIAVTPSDCRLRIAATARRFLGAHYESMLKQVVAQDFTLMFEGEVEDFDARVVKSEIQRMLDELEKRG